MPEVSRLYLDTNIIIHTFEHRDDLSSKLTELLISGDGGPERFHVTSELTVAELVVGPFRDGDDMRLRRYHDLTQSNSVLEVYPVTYPDLWNAGKLRSAYSTLKLPDAIHVATAMRSRSSHVLTADKRLTGTYTLNYQWDDHQIGPNSIEVIRPEIPIIDRLIEVRTR